MSDIVGRLRAGASTSPDVGSHVRKYQELCDEAATVIERLQADNVKLSEIGIALTSEVNKLTYELTNRNDRVVHLKSALAVAHVDVQRLQAELEELKLRYSFDAG